MFEMFSVKKKNNTPAEERLEEIKNILFPPLESKETVNEKTGESLKYQIDYSVDMNLDGVLLDIQEGYVDEVVTKTIKDATDRISRVRDILEAHANVDREAEYIIVDTPESHSSIEDIEASEV